MCLIACAKKTCLSDETFFGIMFHMREVGKEKKKERKEVEGIRERLPKDEKGYDEFITKRKERKKERES